MNIIGVSQKAIVLNKEGRMLTLFRTETAPTRPNTWDLPGGDLDFGEDATESIIREIQEETGLSVENVRPFDVESIINDNGDFWVTIAYYAYVTTEEMKLSSEHNQYMWLLVEEFLKINTSARAQKFVENLIKISPPPFVYKK